MDIKILVFVKKLFFRGNGASFTQCRVKGAFCIFSQHEGSGGLKDRIKSNTGRWEIKGSVRNDNDKHSNQYGVE